MQKRNRRTWIIVFLTVFNINGFSADWPQWRYDEGRTGNSPATLPEGELKLVWQRDLPRLQPAFRDPRLQFDSGYEPVVLGKTMFIGSSRDDSLLALDVDTGAVKWRYFSEGPIRFAPVAWNDNVYFGSDDGHLHCLDAANGKLHWKFRAVPSERKLLGNRRLISTWPVRGGPVIQNGNIYFAAGVWPFEGVFIYSLDATTGKVNWLNDSCGYIYGIHPHNAEAYGGLAPQGYLLVNGDELIVPGSSAYPARFDLHTGKLLDFQLPAAGRKPGGWFVSTRTKSGKSKLGLLDTEEVTRKRELLFDRSVNQKKHEDKLWEVGSQDVRNIISAGPQNYSFTDKFPGISHPVHTLLSADEKLFVVTTEGEILCYTTDNNNQPVVHHKRETTLPDSTDSKAQQILDATEIDRGFAIVCGQSDTAFLTTLGTRSKLKVVAIEPDKEKVDNHRTVLQSADLYGHRVALIHGQPLDMDLPRYLADVMVLQSDESPTEIEKLAESVRPFGGKMVIPATPEADKLKLPGFTVSKHGNYTILTRASLPGSTNYSGDWNESSDELVRAPFGVLWFDDTLGHFKRSPQPKFIDGVMISVDKTWTDASTRKGKVDYRLKHSVFTDVYTGRILDETEATVLRQSFSNRDFETVQPSQYRPPRQKSDYKPEPPLAGTRRNPLTGEDEPRVFPKSYGCDGGFDYGNLYTMRSGTAAVYDKRLESGTINLSGPRSGCTNSITPANGVLNVPYFFEGCTCSYPLPTAFSLVSMPKTHEQWAAWGEVPAESIEGKIERIGINFGAPGDRMTDEGTLWLDYPNVGGPSPQISLEVSPVESIKYHYRHSIWINDKSESAWPWVVSSSVIGADKIRLTGLKNGTYDVRLYFGELMDDERSFDIRIQEKPFRSDFSPRKEAGDTFRGVVLTSPRTQINDGAFLLQMTPKSGNTSLSGLELIRMPDGE
ncbi:MAG: PQQ-binding-like beta-propeller repeat protein [Verrucomicrobiales bacterium]|nr:PQQ-binding-like beta-propeller repeat protein [Verrucomicrobiales bacterium]